MLAPKDRQRVGVPGGRGGRRQDGCGLLDAPSGLGQLRHAISAGSGAIVVVGGAMLLPMKKAPEDQVTLIATDVRASGRNNRR